MVLQTTLILILSIVLIIILSSVYKINTFFVLLFIAILAGVASGQSLLGIINSLKTGTDKVAESYETYHFKDAVMETMNIVHDANKYFNDTEPWKAIKEKPERCGK